ncbi:MAG: PilN domain-containing protein [Methylococcales bacterium]
MIQQINLYQDCLKSGQSRSGFSTYVNGIIAVLVLGVLLSLYTFWQLHSTEQQLSVVKKNLDAEQTHLKQLIAGLPSQEADPLLAQQLKQLQTSTTELKQTLQLLHNNADWPEGFSKYLQALANQANPEVWLTSIYVDEQKHLLTLKGSTLKAEKIAVFLQQLQKEPIFKGLAFAKLLILQSETNPKQLDFNISTSIEAQPAQDHDQ